MADESVFDELIKRVGEANPRPRLEPVARLAKYLGEPQKSFPIIHVGGTNGKTSTSRAIERLLREHGLKTGLFTSPHLVNFSERIRIDGEETTEERLREGWDEMLPALRIVDEELFKDGQSPITFFEALVVLAFVVFADAPIDVAIIEVGMGGEWDATNIVEAEIAVLTPIDLDHTHILGKTIAEIAKTKTGIIKPKSIVITSQQDKKAAEIISAEAARLSSKLYALGKDFHITNRLSAVGGQVFDLQGVKKTSYTNVMLPLFGAFQAENVALAITAVEAYFGFAKELPHEILQNALVDLKSPGRLDIVSRKPLVIVDAAHNPPGALKLKTALEEHFSYDELLVVFGVLDDKDFKGLADILLPMAHTVFYTSPNSPRSKAPEVLYDSTAEVLKEKPFNIFEKSEDAFDEASHWANTGENRLVLVVGSVILAGEALQYFKNDGDA